MKAVFRASLCDALIKMQHFICLVAAIDRKLENRENQIRGTFVVEPEIDSDCLSPGTSSMFYNSK